MANLPAAKKSIKQDKKRHLRNIDVKSELKTLVKKLNALIDSGQTEQARKMLSVTISALDKAVKKNILKKRHADRKKSRLSAKVAKLKK